MQPRTEARGRFFGPVLIVLILLALPSFASAAPAASLEKDSIDFGTWNTRNDIVGAGSVSVKSTGTEDLIVESVTLIQPDGGPFAEIDDPTCGLPIAPGSSCEVGSWFYYHSSPSGPWSGTIQVRTNASEQPLEVYLSGTIERTTVTLDRSPHDFGTVLIGTDSPPEHTFTVTSTGSRPFVPRTRVSGEEAASFPITENSCDQMIQPGASCEITVAFRPDGGEPGVRTAFLGIDQGFVDFGVELVGEAVVPVPVPEPVIPRIGIRLPEKIRAGGRLRIRTTVRNQNEQISRPVRIRVLVASRLIRQEPRRVIRIPALNPGASAIRRREFNVRRSAGGRKLRVRVVALSDGKMIWSANRTVRVVSRPGRP